MEAFKILRDVCEHAQASGLIKSLQSATAVQQALQQVAQALDELQELRKKVINLEKEKSNSELHS